MVPSDEVCQRRHVHWGQADSKGTRVYANGDVYTGATGSYGDPCGEGSITYANSNTYTGAVWGFRAHQQHHGIGDGGIEDRDGKYWHGPGHHGPGGGVGTMAYANGDVYSRDSALERGSYRTQMAMIPLTATGLTTDPPSASS